MDSLDDPFAAVDKELEACPLGAVADAIVVDHARRGSHVAEKMAMGHFCDGRASLVVGTHTHVRKPPIVQILLGGTAYQTDAGACADYDSVIGNQKEKSLCAALHHPESPARPLQARRRAGHSLWGLCGDRQRHGTGSPCRADPHRRAAQRNGAGCGSGFRHLTGQGVGAPFGFGGGWSRLSRVSFPVFKWSSLAKRRSVIAIHSAKVTLPSRLASAAAIGSGSLISE